MIAETQGWKVKGDFCLERVVRKGLSYRGDLKLYIQLYLFQFNSELS